MLKPDRLDQAVPQQPYSTHTEEAGRKHQGKTGFHRAVKIMGKVEEPAEMFQPFVQQDTLLRIAIPKRKSDVSRVDEHWVLDEHFLPIYIQHNGIICTASLLDVSDQFSDFHIHRIVFPTKQRAEDGHVYKASFTKEGAATFYATAMHKPDRSPEYFYNDNDKRFVHMQQHLPRLTASEESAIQMHVSIAGQPWGRGRKERLYRSLQRFLKRLPGYYNKRNRFTIRKAIKDPSKLFTLEKIKHEMDVFIDVK